MKIIIDAFGGDNAPGAVLEGCAQAVRELGAEVILTGDEEKIRAAAGERNVSLTGIKIAHAPTVIPVCEEPTQVLKKYGDCSMAKGLQMLAAGEGETVENFSASLAQTFETVTYKLFGEGGVPSHMSQRQKQEIVRRLDECGVFLIKGAVPEVAQLMGSSVASVYRYLSNVRREG